MMMPCKLIHLRGKVGKVERAAKAGIHPEAKVEKVAIRQDGEEKPMGHTTKEENVVPKDLVDTALPEPH